MNDTIVYWFLFFAINSIYFIPRYVMDYAATQFLPVRGLFRGTYGERFNWIIIRFNYDIFRLCIDYFVLITAYVLILRDLVDQDIFMIVCWLYFGASFIYQLYFTIFHKIYKIEPVLFNDLFVLRTAFRIFIYDFKWRSILITLAALLCIPVSFILFDLLFNYAKTASFGPWSYILVSVLTVLSIISLVRFKYRQTPLMAFQSPLVSFLLNIQRSIRARRELKGLTLNRMTEFNIDPALSLSAHPNVFLIMVESYGGIMLTDGVLSAHYREYMEGNEKRLGEAGWQVASALTESPVSGGSSWLSYTSVLYGLRVAAQGVFLTLMKNVYIDQYDSLFWWLKRQGYTTYRLSSLGGYDKMEIPYDSYSRMYGIDRWIKYRDLGYDGPEYGFGPCPPDQYSIHFGRNVIEKEGKVPFAMFFITQNSHTPYDSPPEVVDDWRSLSQGAKSGATESKFWSRPKFEKYGRAIEYQMQYLTDFVLKTGTDNDLFIIIGDHQPPSFKNNSHGFETPAHIISRNTRLLEAFAGHGFTEGLVPVPGDKMIAHEGFRTLIIRSLMTEFSGSSKLPAHLPDGIPFK